MSFDILKNHVVQLKVNNCRSTGVIFKPESDSNCLYILTAKHNFFFPKETYLQYDLLEKNLEEDTTDIIHETTGEKINPIPSIVYFFEPIKITDTNFSDIDLALIIVKNATANNDSSQNHLKIDALSIADDHESQVSIYDIQYSLFGYPEYRNASDKNIAHCKLQFNQVRSDCFFKEEFTNLTGFIGFDELDDQQNTLDGISGSPIFLLSKSQTPHLKSIVYASDKFNIINSIKLNTLIDAVNSRIKQIDENLPDIQISTKITLINESLNISEIKGYHDFKNRILEKSKLLEFYKKPIETEVTLKQVAYLLSEEHRKLKDQCESLSNKYAHLAILAADKGLKASTTSYLKKAIEWNSDHIHLLLHEKAERTQNKELLKSLTPILLNDKIKKYDKLINIENGQDEIKELLKEAIKELTPHLAKELDNKIAHLKIIEYCTELEKIFFDNKTQKPIEKYIEIARFYFENHLSKRSFKFYSISLELLNKSSKNEYNNNLSDNIKNRLIDVQEKNKNYDFLVDAQEAKKTAKAIIEEDEDKETKEIIFKLYHEVTTLKYKEQSRDEFYRELLDALLSLNISIDKQIMQNIDSNLKIKQGNANIDSFSTLLNNLGNQLDEIPEKFDIQIDDKTRSELSSIIEEPTETMNFTLKTINAIADDASNYIKTSENSLKILINHEQEGLSFIHKDIKENIDILSKQQAKLKTEKSEVLGFLKTSELRILAEIQKLDINTKHKNKTIEFIQDKISQLQKLVNAATIVQSNNHSDLIKSANNTTKDLKQIIITCQELETSALGQFRNTSDYTDDITIIKRSQNRFEKSLLNQTKNAFANYEKITEYNTTRLSLSFGQKALLSIYFIIMISCAIYFIINYSLLDLLANLWHTALQKFNR